MKKMFFGFLLISILAGCATVGSESKKDPCYCNGDWKMITPDYSIQTWINPSTIKHLKEKVYSVEVRDGKSFYDSSFTYLIDCTTKESVIAVSSNLKTNTSFKNSLGTFDKSGAFSPTWKIINFVCNNGK